MIKSAQFSNEDHSAMTIITEENGAVSISERDNPELWAEALKMDPPSYIPAEIKPVFDVEKRLRALEAAVIDKTPVTKADIDAQVEVVADEPGAIIRK